MATDVIMPQMGESIAEGTITRWIKNVGDTVERDEPILEISTDKVDVDVQAPVSGVLLEVLFKEGDTVEVDVVIARIGKEGEAAAGAAGASAELPGAVPAAVAAKPVAVTSEGSAVPLQERVKVFSSPVVRKIAKEENIDISHVPGSGVHGRVTKADILGYLEARAAGTLPAPSVSRSATEVSGDFDAVAKGAVARSASMAPEGFEYSAPAYLAGENVRIEPMSRIRKLTAAHMLYSQQVSAHVATVFDVDLSNVVAARSRAKDGFAKAVGTKLTYMPFFFKAATEGLKRFPKFNASIDGTDIVFKQDVNLGMAVATEAGLLVPVIKNAEQMNLLGFAKSANDLADRARTKKLKPEDLQGGTFTITNPGVFGSLYGLPIINQPQVAILCLGAIEKRVVVVTDSLGNDSLSIRPMAYIALSYDHRLIDGADAEGFMVEVKRVLVEDTWNELDPYA